MTEPSPGPSWFPTPPPKPLQAPSAAKIAFGAFIAVLAVAAAAVALSSTGGSNHKATTTAPLSTGSRGVATPSAQDRRQAFDDCMKSMGAGSPAPRSRFGGGGPSQSFRNAFGVCRSLLQSGVLDPGATGATGTTAAPPA